MWCQVLYIINTLLMSFHTLFLISRFTTYSIFTQTGAWRPPACSFMKSHDAILFCPSQGPISDCSAFCHFAHSPSHWRLHQGRGALCWLHNLGRGQYRHQGWPNEKGTPLRKHTQASKLNYKMQWFTAPRLTWCVSFQITYYNQATPGVLPYISTDIAGLSSGFYSAFSACSHFLEANKDSPAASPLLQQEGLGSSLCLHPSAPVVEILDSWRNHIWIQVSHHESPDVFCKSLILCSLWMTLLFLKMREILLKKDKEIYCIVFSSLHVFSKINRCEARVRLFLSLSWILSLFKVYWSH